MCTKVECGYICKYVVKKWVEICIKYWIQKSKTNGAEGRTQLKICMKNSLQQISSSISIYLYSSVSHIQSARVVYKL